MLREDRVTYFYNPDGELRFDEQQDKLDADNPTVESMLNSRLFGTPFVSADMFAPWGLHSASFLDTDGECIAVQLAALGFCNGNVEHVHHQFDAISQGYVHRKTAHHTKTVRAGKAMGSLRILSRSSHDSRV